MERRKEPRFETAQPATLTVLSEERTVVPVMLLNVSGNGMGVESPEPIAPNAMVLIEAGNSMYLGDVCFCRREEDGRYTCGVHVEHVLGDLSGLAILAERVSAEIGGLERPQLVNSSQY